VDLRRLRPLPPLLAAWTLAPGDARACDPDPCLELPAVQSLKLRGEEVPADGVLVLQLGLAGDVDPAAVAARLGIAVTRDGEPVAGTLAASPARTLLTWRPGAPLVEGATYSVVAALDNPDEVADAGCGPRSLVLEAAFTAAAPAAPVAAPALDITASPLDLEVLNLTDLVCCDDAYPFEQDQCGASLGVTWSKGDCAGLTGQRTLRVQIDVDPGAPPARADQWIRALRQDGELVALGPATTFVRELAAPTCFTVEQRSLATDEVVAADERCFGDDLPLGPYERDPTAALAGCATDIYTCTIDAGGWTRDCETWYPNGEPPPKPDADDTPAADGCGCTGAHPGPLCLLLLALRRRSRRVGSA
jgi:hypothetical protein